MNADLPKLRKDAAQLLAQGKFSDAIRLLKRIAKFAPGDASVIHALGVACLQSGQATDAVGHFEKALALAGRRNAGLLGNLARAQMMAEQWDAATKTFEEAVEAGATDVDTLMLLCRLFEITRRFADLRDFLARAVRWHPASPVLILYLAEEFLAAGKKDEALAAVGDVSRLDLDDPDLALRAAPSLLQLSKPGDVVTILGKAAVNGAAPGALHPLLREGLKAAYGAQVIENLRDLVAASGNPALRFQLAWALSEKGHFREAEEALRDIGPLIPENMISELQARISLGVGDPDGAIAHFDAIWDRVASEVKAKEPSPENVLPKRPYKPIAPLIYMPVEVGERELSSRVYTALFAAQNGLSSVIVPARSIPSVAEDIPPGIFLHKTLNSIDRAKILSATRQGHLFAAIDEEAMAWTGSTEDMLCGSDAVAISLVDMIFVAGEKHARAYREMYPRSAAKIRVVGNPRIDLLGPGFRAEFEAEAQKIRNKYGKFILVCTNFGSINSIDFNFEWSCRVFLQVTAPKPGTDYFDDVIEMGRSAAHAEATYWHALETILPVVAEQCPKYKFVVRPHPNESPEYWLRLARKHLNVLVESGGPLQPWLFAASAMVHMAGCATGLEAYLADVPAFRVMVNPSLIFPQYGLSCALNTAVQSAEELTSQIRKLDGNSETVRTADDQALVADHISMGPVLSAQRIADALYELYEKHAPKKAVAVKDLTERLSAVLSEGAKLGERHVRGALNMARKQVVLDVEAIKLAAAGAAQALGLGVRIEVSKIGADAILISPAGTQDQGAAAK